MSDFALLSHQRAALLAGDYSALVFPCLDWPRDVKPESCKPGARYVLQWAREQRIDLGDGSVKVIDRHPVWWIVVTSVQRRSAGGWSVRFDVTDLRDPTLWLKRSGGYQASAMGAVDSRPVVVDESVRARVREEFWHARRLARFALEQRARSRARRQRRAA